MTAPACDPLPAAGPAAAARARLLDRVARSADAARAFVTRRHRAGTGVPIAAGVTAQALYAAAGEPGRAGQPRRVRLIGLAAGAVWTTPAPAPGDRSEWLVLQGRIDIDGEPLAARDYRHAVGGAAPAVLHSAGGALLYLRESPAPRSAAAGVVTRRDAGTPWDNFAPGIRRRVLWTDGAEAAMLYDTLPGAAVPGHGHRHDEECLMLDGEVFLDDVLLRRFDWQLAPAGTTHAGVATDTGGVVFAHGDLDLDLHPG